MRIGLAVGAFSTTFVMTWAVGLFRLLLHIERGGKILSYLHLMGGSLTAMVPLFACITWLTAAFRPEQDPAIIRISATAVLGLIFVLIKTVEYMLEFRAGHTLSSSAFFMYYYVITGLHLTHVIAGITALTMVAAGQRHRRSPRRHRIIVESTATYWHFVDLLWMFIFPLVYFAR
jgi:heme/copper-type cytochrome/quinol oxidase subunit 3